jgi:hypothetical protein
LSGIPALLTGADTDLEASDNNYLCLKAQFQPGPVFLTGMPFQKAPAQRHLRKTNLKHLRVGVKAFQKVKVLEWF